MQEPINQIAAVRAIKH